MPLLAFTYIVMLLCFVTIHSSRVTLSLFALQLGAGPSLLGLLLATFYVFPLAISWPVGALSDRIGSRALMLLGVAVGVIGMIVAFLTRTVGGIFVGGMLVGMSFSFYNVLLQNLVGLLSPPERRAKSFSNAAVIGAVAAFVGPLIAGLTIDHLGYPAACLCTTVPLLAAFAMLAIGGRKLPAGAVHMAPAQGVREAFAKPGTTRILATSGIAQFAQDLFSFYIPVYGHAVGLAASLIGVVLASFATATFVVRFLLMRLIDWLGAEKLLTVAFLLTALGAAMVPLTADVVLLCMIAFTAGLGIGCGQPLTTIMMFRGSTAGRTGSALGLRLSVNNLVRAAGPPVLGLVAAGYGFIPLFWMATALIAFGGWLAYPTSSAGGRNGRGTPG